MLVCGFSILMILSDIVFCLNFKKARYASLQGRSTDRKNRMEEALPVATRFQETHDKLSTWLVTMPIEEKFGGSMTGLDKKPSNVGPEAEKLLEVL